ncbi:MAG: BRO family protein [Clostridia bacterium]|nr:BRO family protein [Clostridia bacterium]
MNNLEIFKSEEFGEVRTMLIDNEPWFVGKDVAESLGYEDTVNALKQHIDTDDKIMGCQNTTPSIIDKLGRKQYPTFINESGLYALIFGSKLEAAKRFKRWVTHDVLPSIRKTGQYKQYNPSWEEEAKRILECKEEMKNDWFKKMGPVMQSIADSMGISRKQLYSMAIDEVENHTNLKTRELELQANYGFIPAYKMDIIEMYKDLQKTFEKAVFDLFTTHLNRSVRNSYEYNLIATDKTILNNCDKIEEAL